MQEKQITMRIKRFFKLAIILALVGVASTNCERAFFPHLNIYSEVGDTINADYQTDTFEVFIDCNTTWYQNTFPEWIYMNPNAGSSSDTAMIVIWENKTKEARDTILTIRTETIARHLILHQQCDTTIVEEENPENPDGGETPDAE